MRPRITVITIGVDDLERSLAFYRDGLGLKTDGIVGEEFEYGAVVFIDLENGAKLALWPRKSIARDTGLSLQDPSATEFTLGHNLNSKKEVDEVMVQAQKAGAKIVKPAQQTFWGGYSGCFQDPDGHLWEVTWNPDWKIED
ncbi:MAG TPA: VOC family protein [Anaerolineales bacterium]|nr:VOC family protein [Anaerolineales bacterium]